MVIFPSFGLCFYIKNVWNLQARGMRSTHVFHSEVPWFPVWVGLHLHAERKTNQPLSIKLRVITNTKHSCVIICVHTHRNSFTRSFSTLLWVDRDVSNQYASIHKPKYLYLMSNICKHLEVCMCYSCWWWIRFHPSMRVHTHTHTHQSLESPLFLLLLTPFHLFPPTSSSFSSSSLFNPTPHSVIHRPSLPCLSPSWLHPHSSRSSLVMWVTSLVKQLWYSMSSSWIWDSRCLSSYWGRDLRRKSHQCGKKLQVSIIVIICFFFFSLAFLQCTQTSLAFLLSKTFNINCSPTPFPSLKLISFCLHKKFYPRSSFNISKAHRRAITQHDENCVYSFL